MEGEYKKYNDDDDILDDEILDDEILDDEILDDKILDYKIIMNCINIHKKMRH
jgi:hypothetical protein